MAYFRASRFRAGRCGREALRHRLSAELARIFHPARGCAISDHGRYQPHSGLHVVHPELGGSVRLHGTCRSILRRAQANRKGADRTLRKINERSVSRFDPAGIAAILRSHAFCAIEDISFQEIASRFGHAVQGLRQDTLASMLSTLSANGTRLCFAFNLRLDA